MERRRGTWANSSQGRPDHAGSCPQQHSFSTEESSYWVCGENSRSNKAVVRLAEFGFAICVQGKEDRKSRAMSHLEV